MADRNPRLIINILLIKISFSFLTLSVSINLFTLLGIWLWFTDYAQVILKIELKEILIYFSIDCWVAPTLGVLVGRLITFHAGGIQSPKAL